MRKTLFTSFLALSSLFFNYANAQCKECHEGKHTNNEKVNTNYYNHSLPPDSSGGLAQSFILQNICGLNWVQSSVLVETRSSIYNFNANGTGLPTTVPLTLSSCNNIDSVVHAFLYFSGSYVGAYAANPASVTITNPASVVFNYSVDSIGTSGPKCWGDSGSIAYRADVTNCINGGGNYQLNLSGTGITAWGIDGVTLLVIYVDKSANYTGSIVLWDGMRTVYATTSQTFTGFNICSNTANAQAFSVLSDMQSNVSGGTNTETYNNSTATFPNLFYNFCAVSTSLRTSQTFSTYSVYTNNAGDCYSWSLAGLYWQNTNCTTCNPTILATDTVHVIPAKDTICYGDSTRLTATGCSTYIWTPATGLSCSNCANPEASPNVNTTYTVTGFKGCTFGIDTVQVLVGPPASSLTVTPTSASICLGDSVQLTISGGSNYKWKPSNTLSCSTCSNPVATPAATTTYTVVSGFGGCVDSAMVTITVVTPPIISITPKNPKICEGGSVLLYASGAPNYVWAPASSLNCNTCVVPTASPTVTTTYTLVGDLLGCRKFATDSVYVVPAPGAAITPLTDTICMGDSVVLHGSGNGTYAWSNGKTTGAIVVNPASSTIYTLKVSNGVCTDSANAMVIIEVCTGMNQFTNDNLQLTIYPNPSNGMVTLESSVVSGQSSEVRISILNELGQVVYDNTETRNTGNYKEQLNLENLSLGVYTLRLQTNTGSTVRKLMIIGNR